MRTCSEERTRFRLSRIKASILGAAALVVIALIQTGAAAQEPPDAAMIAKIRAEELNHSAASDVFYMLTDVIGPRLSGSPAYDQAAHWAVDRLKQWGLANTHLEPFKFGRGWTLEKLTLEMTAPRYMPLLGYAEAWSPSTSGVLTGTPIYVGDSTIEEIDALGTRLHNAIVLTARPQTEFLRKDRPQPSEGDEPVQTGNPPFPGPSSRTPRRDLLARLQKYGAGVALAPSATQHGTVRVQGNPATAPDAVPTLTLAAEQYNMLVRLVKAGEPVALRTEVSVRFSQDRLDSDNVLAEIPGTDPALKDEVVMLGAHLDSWHTAEGATDNADAVTAAMEAMRILAALHASPRRTIRVALWGGEEQGLIGSRAWVEQHLADKAARDRISVYLNDDPGTGRTYGFYMEKNAAAKQIFDAWLAPLADLGMRRNVIEGIGSTDHVPFIQAGVPAFNTIKDFENYDVRTRHTNADFPDAVKIEDVRQSAVVLAIFAWHAAMRDERIPRLR
jgi:carboxypeptidase Q